MFATLVVMPFMKSLVLRILMDLEAHKGAVKKLTIKSFIWVLLIIHVIALDLLYTR